jgi:hypothetical protein
MIDFSCVTIILQIREKYSSGLSMGERAMWTLSHQYDWSNVLVRVAHQQLKLIVNELNETAHLAVREGKNALFIYSAHANHIIAVAGQTGELVLLYCTAHDKALLADADERDLTSQFGSGPLPKYTQRNPLHGCVATFRIAAGDMKELRNDNSTGNLQMAADRTQPHTLCGSVVSPLSSFAARC